MFIEFLELADRDVLDEGFDGFVGSEAELAVEVGSGFVAVFGALPEEAFVATHEWCTFHLRLVFEDGVAFCAKFLW